MSSKGRKQVDAPPNENFPTEAWVVEALLDEVSLPMTGLWLEPCAGEGAILDAVHDWVGKQSRGPMSQFLPPVWDCVEIRQEGADYLNRMQGNRTNPVSSHIRSVYCTDFRSWTPTTWEPNDPYQVVISNPPFSLAMEIIQKSFQVTKGHVIMLQRLNFLGSKKRAPFWWKYPPDVYVLGMNRPSFKVDGSTDSIEYGWFVWPPGEREREHGQIRVLRGGRPR